MSSRVRVAVVDDHPLYRQGIVQALASCDAFEVVGEGGSADDAIALAAERSPDLMVLDVVLPGGGIQAAESILETNDRIRIVMLSVVEDMRSVMRAFRAGVSGYLLKGIGGSELVRNAEAVAAGARCVAPQLMEQFLDCMTGKAPSPATSEPDIGFANREEQILTLLAQGMSNKEIAFRLNICEKTAKYYLTNIMKKLNAKNRVEVALFASRRSDQASFRRNH